MLSHNFNVVDSITYINGGGEGDVFCCWVETVGSCEGLALGSLDGDSVGDTEGDAVG